ncbi:MAG: coproporphyrinogen III oxidase family protein [Deltaproteobacteria bacterium]|nr:coproporphyrinogen III oxidase family protein [Deltaproteobacteria bacterium]
MVVENLIARMVRSMSAHYFAFEDGRPEPPCAPAEPIYLYIHIPFCAELCPYCSFHRVPYQEERAREYFRALGREIEMYRDRGFSFAGVYVGGGTPTILLDELLALLARIQRDFSPGEVSVETNPDRLDARTLKLLADAGVKRVSVGIQTFSDPLLKSIGRYDKYGSSRVLKERLAKARGFVQTLNADMIYNFPTQSRAMVEQDLEALKEASPDQITFYPLMISDATRKKMTDLMGRVSYRKERLFYSLITSRLAEDYRASSAWCFSKKDAAMVDEYVVVSQEYVGAGSGAFGLVGGGIYANTFSLPAYCERIFRGEFPLSARRLFSVRELSRYALLMGLFGLSLDIAPFRKRFGSPPWWLLGPELLFFLLAGGIRIEQGRIRLTSRGQYYWVVMMREFFTGVDNFRDLSREAAGITAS